MVIAEIKNTKNAKYKLSHWQMFPDETKIRSNISLNLVNLFEPFRKINVTKNKKDLRFFLTMKTIELFNLFKIAREKKKTLNSENKRTSNGRFFAYKLELRCIDAAMEFCQGCSY
mmetsp:Transcript_8098/g.17598  ORF Transcript_8098/g.17598 Transcript_8098/m.17598 type:complete len:115 (-) Transcript_8098:356-700(-)